MHADIRSSQAYLARSQSIRVDIRRVKKNESGRTWIPFLLSCRMVKLQPQRGVPKLRKAHKKTLRPSKSDAFVSFNLSCATRSRTRCAAIAFFLLLAFLQLPSSRQGSKKSRQLRPVLATMTALFERENRSISDNAANLKAMVG